jgi:Na+/H+ antiporter NhaD/arsenite permease-like protein
MSKWNWPLILSIVVFGLTYVGILMEKVHRALVVLVGAVAMVCVGTWAHFYSSGGAIAAVDYNTVVLLFGMMVLVALFKETGFFEYVAIVAARITKGRPWLLFLSLGLATTLISMILDNVTTIILMIPVTMSIADILGVSMIPFLIGEVMLSNIGGVATLIGDPPNILIGTAAGFSFTDFLTHLAPIVLLVWVLAQGILLLFFRRALFTVPVNAARLREMNPRDALTDPRSTRRLLIVLASVVVLFFVHDRIGLESGIVALLGATAGLLWLWPDIKPVLQEIHWDVLVFFVGLFVIVGGLEAAGALDIAASAMRNLTTHGIALAALSLLWLAGIMSAIVDNVPFTIAMLPVLAALSAKGVYTAPLWWALALGVGFGGNATPVGSTSNVIMISASEKTRSPIGSRLWLKHGIPIAFGSCVLASLLLLAAIELHLF